MYDREWLSNYYSTPPVERPILGVVWHDTETFAAVACHNAGSWHYQIDRSGEIILHIAEDFVAWGAAGMPKRWRPAWVVNPPSSLGVSGLNWCGIHVELVSNATHRAAGVPFTDEQYDSVIRFTAELQARRGPLWHVGHGDVQADRSDPVALDWTRAGFGPNDGVNGRAFVAREQEDEEMTDAERQELQATIDNQNGVINELSGQVSSLTWLLGLAQGERDGMAAEVERLRAEDAATLSPEDAAKIEKYDRIAALVAAP